MDFNLEAIQACLSIYAIKIPVALLIFLVGRWLSRRLSKLVGGVIGKSGGDEVLVNFLRHVAYYALLTAVIIMAVGHLGINTASLLTVLGAAGLAVGLALKDSLSNFAAGVMLLIHRPFRIGDYVQAGGAAGTVKRLGISHTEMVSPDNQRILVPNSRILGDNITNVTANDTRRLDLVFGISYSDDMAKAKEIIGKVFSEEKRILAEPAPVIAVAELADSSVNLVARPWVATSDYWPVRFDLTERIKAAFDAEGISIPFPQQDVHLFRQQAEGAAQ